ncbi:hypothetical protein [Dickeya lacustris]|uniref:Uncharacterized protein n=1 Tax=Dickeya lacustris TaxID=2259638 RepID=A0ABY8GBF9_9GAMM|nr:hypothetical protein [Dickeya lacustris]WFN57308.1 hypothetical protein O1Q98_09005 [Dickeya lacustris]
MSGTRAAKTQPTARFGPRHTTDSERLAMPAMTIVNPDWLQG